MVIRRILASIHKEFLLLSRDRAGILLLFVMPLALVTIMALVQDAPFKDYQEIRLPALAVNKDKNQVGNNICSGLDSTGMFEITYGNMAFEEAKARVDAEEFQVAIIIPDSTTERMKLKVNNLVVKTLAGLGLPEDTLQPVSAEPDTILLYMKPGMKKAVASAIQGAIKQTMARLESEELIRAYGKKLGVPESTSAGSAKKEVGFIPLSFSKSSNQGDEIKAMNSVQHNVPAWTMFGMFFIVISLAGSMVTERASGSYKRIRTMPGAYWEIVFSKLFAYLVVCLAQCTMMLLAGLYILPALGLDKLVIGSHFNALALVTLSSALAATGLGILVGTVFKTHQQTSTFGSVSVVILAALGGVWVPVYVMPEILKTFAGLSPLNWGLSAYQNVFLGDGNLGSVKGQVSNLLIFFAINMICSLIFEKWMNNRQAK